MNRYESYKNSGVEWIKSIPLNWELKKIKYVLWERNKNNDPIKSKNLISLTIETGVIPHSEKTGGGNKPKDDLTKYKLVYPGDIVLNSMNVIFGAVGISKYFGIVSPVYYMLIPIDNRFTTEYFHHLFRTEIFQKSLYGLGNGILIHRMRIPMDKLGVQLIPVPPLQEQKLIARYLDKKTAQIDLLIEKIEKKIALLQEKRTALINQCVTKGLDPNVEMKDSGIEWIGKIPKHWGVKKVKHISKIENGSTPKSNINDYWDGDIKWFTPSDFKNINSEGLLVEPSRFISEKGLEQSGCSYIENDSVLVTTRAPVGNIVKIQGGFTFNQGCKSLTPYLINIDFLYLYLSVKDEALNVLANGTTFKELSTYQFMNFKICLPSKKEQSEVINFLESKIFKFQKMTKLLTLKIDRVKEYRQALISSVVTGKVRVTEAML